MTFRETGGCFNYFDPFIRKLAFSKIIPSYTLSNVREPCIDIFTRRIGVAGDVIPDFFRRIRIMNIR